MDITGNLNLLIYNIILGICVHRLDEIHVEFLLTKLKGYLYRKE